MRPTPSEQLRAARGVLTRVVRPELPDGYAAEMLAGVLSALATLEEQLPDWSKRQHDAIVEIDELLAAAVAGVPQPLVDLINRSLDAPPPDWRIADAVRIRYEERRLLLADVVRELGGALGDSPLEQRIIKHLRQHVES